MRSPILLNDFLGFNDISNLKLRLIKNNGDEDPLELFNTDKGKLLNWLLHNGAQKSFKEGQHVIGLLRISDDKWLLFAVVKITKDLNVYNDIGYDFHLLDCYEKYFGRVIVHYKNKVQQLIRNASGVIDACTVHQVLDQEFDDDIFPGYENVNISWIKLKRLINSNAWKTALENQKGVYLITDKSNGKMYVGSAYGDKMIDGRWRSYVKNGHGGNEGLKKLEFEYIKENFSYSILDIYKSTVDDNTILKRESWWKSTLLTREHGYNEN